MPSSWSSVRGHRNARFRRWQHRLKGGQPAVFKPGPPKVVPLKLEELRVASYHLKHGRQRSRGAGRLCRPYQDRISRRDLQALAVWVAKRRRASACR